MSEEDVLAIIGRELGQAVGQDGDPLSKARADALDAYEGRNWQKDMPGRSNVVMRTVQESVEWVLPALLRIFVASDKIAEIEATKPGPQEAEAAQTATDYLTQIFYKDNDGFSLLHDWFKDGLLQRVGWVKRYWATRTTQETESYTGLTPLEYQQKLAELQALGEVETVERREYADPLTGQPLHDCTLTVTKEESRVVIENVPPEEVLFSPKCRRGYMPFVCHRRGKTFSELLQDGYDEDSIRESLGDGRISDEMMRRQQPEVPALTFDDRVDEAMREVWVEESYLLLDYNRDGIAELCKVTSVNSATRVLLRRDGKPDVEAIDESPLVWLCPVPMPHKLSGHSISDFVADLQQIKSVLVRQMLDNLYLTNNPRVILGDMASNEFTVDDLLVSRPGGIIRARDPAGVLPQTVPFVAGAAFPMLEYLDQTAEVRTGVSRHNQGLNPDDLNKTATGVSLIQQAAAQRVELIARIFARSVQELVRGILGLVRRHQQQARIVMVTGKPLTMDPRLWREELDVSVNVGLGTGNRDQVLQHLMTVLQLQQGIVQMQGGPSGPLVYAPNVYAALESLTENAGFKQSFFTDPSQPPPQGTPPPQPKPDPEMMKVQAQMQLAQQKAQADAQVADRKAQQQAQLDERQAQQQMQLEQQKAALEAKLKQMEMAARMALEREDAQNQVIVERTKMIAGLQIEREREAARAALAERELEARVARQDRMPQPQPEPPFGP